MNVNQCVMTVLLMAAWFGPAFAKSVIAVEYPPFTSAHKSDGGLAFSILSQAYPNQGFVAEILPPKRALLRLSNGDWCYSFYPPPKDVLADKITLTEEHVVIGLVRLKQATSFSWSSLSDFNGLKIAVLRSDEHANFSRQFTTAGLSIIYVETISQGLSLVRLKRTQLSMYDNHNYHLLPDTIKSTLQFSETSLLTTPITLFVNPECKHKLVNSDAQSQGN